jgi:hypothetical protein
MDISRATFYTLLYTENHTYANNLCLRPSVGRTKDYIKDFFFTHLKAIDFELFFSLFGLK